mmetsp:Transcript_12235/g.23082  ORF Transcript_12235/g.23082 Transcript_12235/m.23082 type:complete len:108 (-) Transcript_12235:88-411(-)
MWSPRRARGDGLFTRAEDEPRVGGVNNEALVLLSVPASVLQFLFSLSLPFLPSWVSQMCSSPRLAAVLEELLSFARHVSTLRTLLSGAGGSGATPVGLATSVILFQR